MTVTATIARVPISLNHRDPAPAKATNSEIEKRNTHGAKEDERSSG
jgi:hypothetical protein